MTKQDLENLQTSLRLKADYIQRLGKLTPGCWQFALNDMDNIIWNPESIHTIHYQKEEWLMSRLAKFREDEQTELNQPLWHHFEKNQKENKEKELAKNFFY